MKLFWSNDALYILPTVEYEEKLMIFSCFREMFFIK